MVIGGDEEVRSVCSEKGAEWVEDEYLDLNKAIESVFESVWQDSHSAAYAPADLPLLTNSDVNGAIEASEDGRFLTVCRAHDGGTNGLIVPPDTGFRPRLGPDSFRRHKALAVELGIEFRKYHSDGFHRDVDTVEDLRFCMSMRPPCLENIADAIEDVKE